MLLKFERKSCYFFFILKSKSFQFFCKATAVSYLQNLVKRDFFFVKVKDQTHLAINPEDYKHDISLKGEFIRLVLDSDASEEDKAAIIRTGMQALMGEEITL